MRTGADVWEVFWRATARDGRPPLWDVPADLARLTEVLDGSLPVVDVGCGNGTQAVQLAAHFERVIGADASAAAIDLARRTHPHPNVTYVVLDALDTAAVARLHDRCGDANVHLRGVLHQVAPDLRPAFAAAVRRLLGERGTLHLVELAPTAEAYFAALTAGGPPPALSRVLSAGIRPGVLTAEDVMALLGPRYVAVAGGHDVLPTTHTLPGGGRASIPAFHLTARLARD
ncbi:class I SAM-dependent methyltransferase [Saccharothrix obliqua]|uniref:class I SAM-dependent methyltransferase n=1 Tax=Saccharothrix obliqua TaxID=2861747 RepID=UPI001C5EEE0E|nr:class I SAM-dependent methyltransferase [Saccharothrix obliqua]MBW4718164.1 class I SAM-dependent methyltransferase [Saccharothrix obliqua]